MDEMHSLCRPTAALVIGSLTLACGAQSAARGGPADEGQGDSVEALSHEKCGEGVGTIEALDSNGDGKPDVFTVTQGPGGHVLCRYADLNRDGQPDLYEYFDADGNVRRREFVYSSAGDVDAIEEYSGGRLVRRLYDTTGRHRADTWDWFDPGVPINPATGRPTHPSRRERDTRGMGRIDQWWTWSGDTVTIATDRNGDGHPDPESVIVLGGGTRSESSASAVRGDGGAPSDGGGPKVVLDGGWAATDALVPVDGARMTVEASAP
jgi:hypothetical protein